MVHYVALYKLQRIIIIGYQKTKRIIIIIINHPTCLALTGYECSKHMHVQNFGYKQKKKEKEKEKKACNVECSWDQD